MSGGTNLEGLDLPQGQDFLQHVQNLHHRAMDLAGKAWVEEHTYSGDPDAVKEFTRQAFLLEFRAAFLLWRETDLEPTRGVLFRSAAWLAHNCGEYMEAQYLALMGLQGNPPSWIRSELREVLEAATLSRAEIKE